MANEIADVLIPGPMVMVTGTCTVSPTQDEAEVEL